jgi:hypothetical protein
MGAICSSDTSVDFQRTTRRYIPEDRHLHNHRCQNLKSYIGGVCLNFLIKRSQLLYRYVYDQKEQLHMLPTWINIAELRVL